jgi:hypothetical protein
MNKVSQIDKTGRPKEIGGINGALFTRETPEDTISILSIKDRKSWL